MRDDDEYDDRDDDRDDDGPAPFPLGVRLAGVVWIGFGVLSLINLAVSFAVAGGNRGPGATPGSGACGALIGVVFLACGYQTVTGTAKDTRGNGIGSIVFGLLQLLVGGAIAVLGVGGANANPGNPANGGPPLAGVMLITGAVVAAMGVAMITAGVLALVGRRAYLDWRRENAPDEQRRRRRRPRRPDYEDDEYEDRPRRRSDEEDDRPRRRSEDDRHRPRRSGDDDDDDRR